MSTKEAAEAPALKEALAKLDISNLTIDEISALKNDVLRDTLNEVVKKDGAVMHVSHADHVMHNELV